MTSAATLSHPRAATWRDLGIELAACDVPADYAGKSAAVRACAISVLQNQGVTVSAVGRHSDGAPAWPGGWVGSLTHARQRGAVALARASHLRAVGLDLESPDRMKRALWPHVLTPGECTALAPLPEAAANLRAARIFSAKEALYKALAPLGERVPGFHDVEIIWSSEDDFTVRLVAPACAATEAHVRAVRGLAVDCDAHVLALAWLPAAPPPDVAELVMARLGLGFGLQTDPALLRDVLSADMRLHDLPGFAARLGDKLARPAPLRPLLEAICAGINRRQPPLKEFLAAALRAGLIPAPDSAASAAIYRSLHLILLLDTLTLAMLADARFSAEVGEHLLAERQRMGVRRGFFGSFTDLYRLTRKLFSPAKVKTMDYVFLSLYRRLREAGPGKITGALLLEKNLALQLNILEAACTDWKRGDPNNALAGLVLALSPIRAARNRPGSLFLENHLRAGWTALYESWNMAFVVRNVPNPGLMLPKLLMPCLIDCESPDYLYRRGYSLWVAVNLQTFAYGSGRARPLPGREALTGLWGEINRRHACAHLALHTGREISGLADILAAGVSGLR